MREKRDISKVASNVWQAYLLRLTEEAADLNPSIHQHGFD